jgi:hypothetical protein
MEKWVWCAHEGGTCECPSNHARFGTDPYWTEADIEGGEVKCLHGIFGDPIAYWNKVCHCQVLMHSSELDNERAEERATIFDFQAASYASANDAFADTTMVAASAMKFEMVVDDIFGIGDEQLMRMTLPEKGGCNDLYVTLDTTDALDTVELVDVTYEISAIIGIVFKPERLLGRETDAQLVEASHIYGGISTRPCVYVCDRLHSDTQVMR